MSVFLSEFISCFALLVEASWNVMAHALKPDFVFRRNGRVHLNRLGGGRGSVQSTTGSRGVRISGSNDGYTMFRGSVKSTGYPLNSPVSPSFPFPLLVEASWNLMVHAQKSDFFFRRNGRVHLNRRGGGSVQSTTGSRGVHISGSNDGYTVFRGSVKSTGYPLHSPVSPSLPLPCVTVCHHISTGLYYVSSCNKIGFVFLTLSVPS